MCGHLIYYKGTQKNDKGQAFQSGSSIRYPYEKKTYLAPPSPPHRMPQQHSRGISDLNVKSKTIKHLDIVTDRNGLASLPPY